MTPWSTTACRCSKPGRAHFNGKCDAPVAPRGSVPAAGPAAPGGGARSSAQVDEDTDGSMLRAAQAGRCNAPMLGQYWLTMPRDGFNTLDNYRPAIDDSAISHAAAIRIRHCIPAARGWYDAAGFGQFASQAYWGGRVIMGPWTHGNNVPAGANFPNGKLDLDAETLRFFDYYAKGVKNGANQPGVLYYTFNAPQGQEWRTSAKWRWNGDRKVRALGATTLQTTRSRITALISYAGRDVKWSRWPAINR